MELKSVWSSVINEKISRDTVGEDVVEKSIRKDSKAVLARLKKVMYLKFSLGGLCLVLCSVVLTGSFFAPEKFTFYEFIFDLADNRIFLATLIAFLMGMLTWNLRAFREIKRFEISATSVKESLHRFIGIMEKTIKLNVYSETVFNAMALAWVCYLANNKIGFADGIFQIVVIVGLALGLGAIVFYYLSTYQQKIKFGGYLKQLKSNLDDLGEK
jgi:hypothetical protein